MTTLSRTPPHITIALAPDVPARVSYNLAFWDPAPRRMQLDGRLVHLGGFHGQDPLLLTVVDASDQEHIDLLVVPPEADADFAARTLALAGGAGSPGRPDRILDLAAAQAGEPVSSVRA
jgi:hypothetical protein